MYTTLFSVLFLSFIINKFYLKNLNKGIKIVLSIIIAGVLGFLFGYISGAIMSLILCFFCIIIESVVLKKEDGTKSENLIIKRNNLLLSLGLNILFIFIIIGLFNMIDFTHSEITQVGEFFTTMNMNSYTVVTIVTSVLFLHIPCNDIIQGITSSYKINMKKEEEEVNTVEISKNDDGELNIIVSKEVSDNNLGRMIGTIERIILLILVMNGLYSLAGLVLTAKSIARYNKISTDKIFAELYLLGTLLSLLFVVAIVFFL